MKKLIKILLKIAFVVLVLLVPFSLIVGGIAFFVYKKWLEKNNDTEDS